MPLLVEILIEELSELTKVRCTRNSANGETERQSRAKPRDRKV